MKDYFKISVSCYILTGFLFQIPVETEFFGQELLNMSIYWNSLFKYEYLHIYDWFLTAEILFRHIIDELNQENF
jgi:hypothetical protein